MTPTARNLGAPALQDRPPGARIAVASARRSGAPAGRVRMRRRETALSAALSAALHLTALAAFATIAPGGEPSGGSGGAVVVTLVGSDAALAALTAEWAPPDAVAGPDPVGRSERTLASPDPAALREIAPTPAPIALAAAPEPAAADPPPRQPPDQPAQAPPPRGDIPSPSRVTPRPEPGPPATAADPLPRPRPADLRPSPSAVAAATTRSAPQAEARQTTRAAGSGGAREAGPRASATVATGAAAARASAMQTWKAQIHRALQRSLPVPRGFERATRDVRATLALSVAPDGRLRSAEVQHSSGDPALDAAALRSLRRMGRLPRAPAGLNDPAYDFEAPIDLKAP